MITPSPPRDRNRGQAIGGGGSFLSTSGIARSHRGSVRFPSIGIFIASLLPTEFFQPTLGPPRGDTVLERKHHLSHIFLFAKRQRTTTNNDCDDKILRIPVLLFRRQVNSELNYAVSITDDDQFR